MENAIIRINAAIKILIVAMVLGIPVNDLVQSIKTISSILI